MNSNSSILSELSRGLLAIWARLERRRLEMASLERDDLFAKGDLAAYLAALGQQFPDAVEAAKGYLASLDDFSPRKTHRFVVTHQHDGRIESFHHFLGALFYPLILHEMEFGFEPDCVIHVRDCGSLNRHLQALSKQVGVEISLYPAEMARPLIRANADSLLRLPPFDGSNFSDKWLHEHEIEAIRSFGFSWAEVDEAPDIPVLVVSRGESDPHFASQRFHNLYPRHKALNHTGASRRHIPNEDAMIEAISNEVAPHVVTLETTEFHDQIRLFSRARIVIAQHGAGLNGLMWCRPGTCVLEILPIDKLGEPANYFRNMAHQLQLRHSFMIQNGAHEPIDASAVARYVSRRRANTWDILMSQSQDPLIVNART